MMLSERSGLLAGDCDQADCGSIVEQRHTQRALPATRPSDLPNFRKHLVDIRNVKCLTRLSERKVRNTVCWSRIRFLQNLVRRGIGPSECRQVGNSVDKPIDCSREAA